MDNTKQENKNPLLGRCRILQGAWPPLEGVLICRKGRRVAEKQTTGGPQQPPPWTTREERRREMNTSQSRYVHRWVPVERPIAWALKNAFRSG